MTCTIPALPARTVTYARGRRGFVATANGAVATGMVPSTPLVETSITVTALPPDPVVPTYAFGIAKAVEATTATISAINARNGREAAGADAFSMRGDYRPAARPVNEFPHDPCTRSSSGRR